MGINGLWTILKPAEQHMSLGTVALEHQTKHESKSAMRLGVDISTMMGECSAASRGATIHGQFYGGALHILFMKLCDFIKYPIILVFVYDGPGRPAIKRETRVQAQRTPFWVDPSKDIVSAFGYYIHQAPGEAEAELAMLNRHGLIDGIITSDSDVFVFGGKTVYRTIPAKDRNYEGEILVYSSLSISNLLGITHEGFALLALLCGGDYDPAGFIGCGPTRAHALALCGFGEELVKAVRTLGGKSLIDCINQWREKIKLELSTNSLGHLSNRATTLAQNMPSSFPNLGVLDQYLNPVTSQTLNLTQLQWNLQEPSLPHLVQTSSMHLGWRTEDILKARFKTNIWEGVFLQMLYSPLVLYDATRQLVATPNTQALVLSSKLLKRQGRVNPSAPPELQSRLLVSAENFVSLMGFHSTDSNSDQFRVWAPLSILPDKLLLDIQARCNPTAAGPSTTKISKFQARKVTIDPQVIDLTEEDNDASAGAASRSTNIDSSVIDLTANSDSSEST